MAALTFNLARKYPVNINPLGCYTFVMATAAAPHAITVSERFLRRDAVDNAITDLRLEGLAPSNHVRQLLERFIEGELTRDELVSAVCAR